MAEEPESPRLGIELREGFREDPPLHDERTLELMRYLNAMPFQGEGTLEPFSRIPTRVLHRLEQTRCPPLGEHLPPTWLLELARGEWDTKKLLGTLLNRLEGGDPETTYEMALSILRTLGEASEDGHVLRRMLTLEQLRKLRNARETRGTTDAR